FWALPVSGYCLFFLGTACFGQCPFWTVPIKENNIRVLGWRLPMTRRALLLLRQVEPEQPDRVTPGDLVDRVPVQVPELECRLLPRPRPGAVLVGVVRLEGDVVQAHLVEHADADRVLEEAAGDLPVVVRGR